MRTYAIGVLVGFAVAAAVDLAASAGDDELRGLRAEAIALRAELAQRDRQVADLAAAAAECRTALVDAEARAFEAEVLAGAPEGSRWDWRSRTVVPPDAPPVAEPAAAPAVTPEG